ncbi:MAG: PA14 domain-containing protein, partial [Verrucomicrobiota bacterium]|nr:PA14 domain-containing protein [Verrucomicrobiota bacterium]
ELNLIEPVEQKELTPGINYSVYNGQWDKLPDFNELTSSNEGVSEEISADLAGNELNDHYGLMFEGYLKINEEGLYTFSLSSDDGSQFIIGDEMLINNDGLHSFVSVEGRTRLKKGFFPIKILYFENSGDQRLELKYKGPGIKMQPIPKDALFSNKDNKLNE